MSESKIVGRADLERTLSNLEAGAQLPMRSSVVAHIFAQGFLGDEVNAEISSFAESLGCSYFFSEAEPDNVVFTKEPAARFID